VTFLRGAAVVVVAVAAVGGIFVALDFNEGLAISFFVASQVVVLSLQFWLIRTAGYRLIWRRRVRV